MMSDFIKEMRSLEVSDSSGIFLFFFCFDLAEFTVVCLLFCSHTK